MSLKKSLIIFTVLVILIGCSKNEPEKTAVKSPKKPKKIAKMGGKKAAKKLPRVFQAAKYTDNAKWMNGINRSEKDQFFISIGKNDPIPLHINATLQFAQAGETSVKKIYRLENKDNSSIFIRVDKNLDPVGDGYPNKIYVKRLRIRPSSYSKDNEWKNGISLKTTGMFFFVIKKGEAVPVSTGDRLQFSGTGEAAVEHVTQSKTQGQDVNIYVKVNRALDPEKDGAPYVIDILITQ